MNFHCTRLPDGRGGGPIENLIKRGDPETVITAHQMTPELDAGPIYLVSEPISLAGSKAEIQQRFIQPVAEMMRHIVQFQPKPKPQVGKATYFRRLSQEDCDKLWEGR